MLINFAKVFEEINKDLASILEDIQLSIFVKVRVFVIHKSYLEDAVINLFAAFDAPKDDIFYVNEESPVWKRLTKIIVDVKAEGDMNLYKQ
jgi:hypothetical protein